MWLEVVDVLRCEFWVWCDHKKGCDDAGDFASGMYPYHGCQTMQLPKNVEPQHWDRGPMFSSFQSGYITGPPPPQLTAPVSSSAAAYFHVKVCCPMRHKLQYCQHDGWL